MTGFFQIPRLAYKFCCMLALATAARCAQSTRETAEYINAPINLSISLVAAQTHGLNFYSDNREGGFSGYGIFTGTSFASVNADPAQISADIGTAQAFCAVTSQAIYKTAVTIQVGPAASGVGAGTAICDNTSPILSSGTFVAIRARVERPTKPWSSAAIVQVP